MLRAKKLLLCLMVGSVWCSGEDATGAADEATSGGYLIAAGAIGVKQESGLAVVTPPWDQHNLHVLELRFDSHSANVWWYRVPGRHIYVALDHRGHDGCSVCVWICYRDQADQWRLLHYPAQLRGYEAAKPPTEALPTPDMPELDMSKPDMSEPYDVPGDAVPPASDFRPFPDQPVPDAGGAGGSIPADDYFQPAPPTAPSANDATPPFSSDVVPPESP